MGLQWRQKTPGRGSKQRPPGTESLEERSLPSVTAVVNAGNLIVQGSVNNDVIREDMVQRRDGGGLQGGHADFLG